VKVKDHPPYHGEMERKVLINLMARATFDPKTGEFSFKDKFAPSDIANVKTVSTILSSNSFGYDNALTSFEMHKWVR
jgi:fatty acid synthase subunit beta